MTGMLVAMALSVTTMNAALWMASPDWRQSCPRGLYWTLVAGLGLACSSALYFIGLSALGPGPHLLWLDALIAGLIVLMSCSQKKRTAAGHPEAPDPSPCSWTLKAAFGLAAGAALLYFLRDAQLLPHGGWDGWTIWNMRARFLYLGNERWVSLYSELSPLLRPDYPLLLTAQVARLWQWAGAALPEAGLWTALVYGLLTPAFLMFALKRLRGSAEGVSAALVWVCTPFAVLSSAAQQADVPLSFYLMAGLACWVWYRRTNQREWAWLSGLAIGLCVWTKNEGLLFVPVVPVATLLCPSHGKQQARTEGLGAWWAGAAPALILVFAFKFFVARTFIAFPLSSPGSLDPAGLLDPARHALIVKQWAASIPEFGRWFLSVPLILALYAACAWGAGEKPQDTSPRFVWTALLLIFAGYHIAYAVSPLDAAWHTLNSADRLLLQLWPSVLLAFFLTFRCPLMAAGPGRAPSG